MRPRNNAVSEESKEFSGRYSSPDLSQIPSWFLSFLFHKVKPVDCLFHVKLRGGEEGGGRFYMEPLRRSQ